MVPNTVKKYKGISDMPYGSDDDILEEDKALGGFMECTTCSIRPGTAELCSSCLHNREVISQLQSNFEHMGDALHLFAPDLCKELIRRYNAQNLALDHFFGLLKEE